MLGIMTNEARSGKLTDSTDSVGGAHVDAPTRGHRHGHMHRGPRLGGVHSLNDLSAQPDQASPTVGTPKSFDDTLAAVRAVDAKRKKGRGSPINGATQRRRR